MKEVAVHDDRLGAEARPLLEGEAFLRALEQDFRATKVFCKGGGEKNKMDD